MFEDTSFTFVTKTPPASELVRKAANIEKGASTPRRERAGVISRSALREIAEMKQKDLNAADIEGAMKIIEGAARSMGVAVEGE